MLSPINMRNIKLYLVIVIVSFSNWYLMKSKVKIRHFILKVIYPRGNATLIIKLTSVSNQRALTWKMKRRESVMSN